MMFLPSTAGLALKLAREMDPLARVFFGVPVAVPVAVLIVVVVLPEATDIPLLAVLLLVKPTAEDGLELALVLAATGVAAPDRLFCVGVALPVMVL
jgi:hypothetical protein